MMNIKTVLVSVILIAFASCRGDYVTIPPSEQTPVTAGEERTIYKGFYLLNEGNMNSNKASLDYFDYTTGVYHNNIFSERNPMVVKGLGDVGNDIQIYGDKLYAVINCSNLIEVMDAKTAKHITTIPVVNCRYIVFDKGYAYVSSYAGPVEISSNARIGLVAKIDTATLTVVDECIVGYQPDGMVISGNKLYVANSGGYLVSTYDNTVSVIDLNTFTEIKKIEVAINLNRMYQDDYGSIYVTSRGNYETIKSNVYIIDPVSDMVTDTLGIPATEMCIVGDSIYLYSTEWSNSAGKNTITYAIIDVKTRSILSDKFITDGSEKNIRMPYGVKVNPESKEIYVMDATDYVTPGKLYCYTPQGRKKWEVVTGDIPAHIVFTTRAL